MCRGREISIGLPLNFAVNPELLYKTKIMMTWKTYQVKDFRHKRPNTVRCHLYEMSRMDISRNKMGLSGCLVLGGTRECYWTEGFLWEGDDENVLKLTVVKGYTKTNELPILNG